MFLLVPAYPCSPGQKAIKRLCVCVCCFLCVLGLLNIKLRIQSNSQICSCLPHIDVTRCAIEGEIWPQHYFPSLDLGLIGSVENKVRVCITNR